MMLGILLMFAAWFYETGTPQHAPRELETLFWMVEQRARIRTLGCDDQERRCA